MPRKPGLTKEKFFPLLVSRAVIVLLFLCLFTASAYAAGIARGFADSTQLALLRFYAALGIFLAVMSCSGAAIQIRRFLKKRIFRSLGLAACYLLLIIFSAATMLAAVFIIALSVGNSQ